MAKDTGDSPVYAGMARMRPDKIDMPEKSEDLAKKKKRERIRR